MNFAEEVLNNVIEQRRRAKRNVKFVRNNIEELQRIEAATQHLASNVIRVSFDESCNSIDVHYSGGKLVLSSIFSTWRHLGYEPDHRLENEKVSGFSTFWRKEGQDLKFWIVFVSTVCKRVQVGTKMVEQAVYETVCDE